MAAYRCAGCREYKREVYRRVGLGSVCSEACFQTVTRKPKKTVTTTPDVPDAVRAAVLERDRRRCRMCGTVDGVDVHHIAYRSEGGAHTEVNLICLCRAHHALVHGDKRRWQPVLFRYIQTFYGQGRRPSLFMVDRQLNAGAEPIDLGGDTVVSSSHDTQGS